MNREETSKQIAKAIKNQIQTVESYIGPQKWEILSPGGDELFGVSSEYLSEQQVEKLEQSRIDGVFDQNTFFNGEDFHLDAYVESWYWIGVYSKTDLSNDERIELQSLVSSILGFPKGSQ